MQKFEFDDQNWAQDWVGEWYPIFSSLGENTDMIFTKCSRAGEILDVYRIDHAKCDGTGALTILAEQNQTPAISYSKNNVLRPNIFKRGLAFLKYFFDTGVRRINWKTQKYETGGKKMSPKVHVLTVEQTNSLVARARAKKVSLTMYVLKYVDILVREYLQNKQKENIWLIPVDMRAQIMRKNPLSNHYSYVALKVAQGIDLASLNRQFRRSLAYGYHWAAFIRSSERDRIQVSTPQKASERKKKMRE